MAQKETSEEGDGPPWRTELKRIKSTTEGVSEQTMNIIIKFTDLRRENSKLKETNSCLEDEIFAFKQIVVETQLRQLNEIEKLTKEIKELEQTLATLRDQWQPTNNRGKKAFVLFSRSLKLASDRAQSNVAVVCQLKIVSNTSQKQRDSAANVLRPMMQSQGESQHSTPVKLNFYLKIWRV